MMLNSQHCFHNSNSHVHQSQQEEPTMSKRDQTTKAMTRRQEHNARMKRSANAVGLTEFSQKKGQVRALEEFKKRKNQKHLQTSMALRKYRKLMKQEGLEAGTGASRKRKTPTFAEKNDENQQDDPSFDNETNIEDPKPTKRKKMDPFQKSREKAKIAKQRAEEASLRKIANEKEREQKLKRRKQQAKLMQQRSKTGQPIMKHAINNLLYKLEKQQEKDDGVATKARVSKTKSRRKDPPRKQQDMDTYLPKKTKKARKFY